MQRWPSNSFLLNMSLYTQSQFPFFSLLRNMLQKTPIRPHKKRSFFLQNSADKYWHKKKKGEKNPCIPEEYTLTNTLPMHTLSLRVLVSADAVFSQYRQAPQLFVHCHVQSQGSIIKRGCGCGRLSWCTVPTSGTPPHSPDVLKHCTWTAPWVVQGAHCEKLCPEKKIPKWRDYQLTRSILPVKRSP